MILIPIVLLIILLVLIFRPSTAETISLKIKDQTFDLEIAKTVQQQTIGLMNRHSLPQNSGMIFVFGFELPQSFWMKNTYIPLDIIFLDKNGVVINIGHGIPESTSLIKSDRAAKYVIELNEGTAQKLGLNSNDQITLPW
jgi:uncharacterized membrane protein (UPF0127 family)